MSLGNHLNKLYFNLKLYFLDLALAIDLEKTKNRIHQELPKCNWLEQKIKDKEMGQKENLRR